MALLCSAAVRAAPLRLCFYLLFYLLLISIFTHITSALITYDKSALLDIGNRFTNLVQDTLSPNPSWPLEILRNAENKGHRRRNKKHRVKSAGIRNRLSFFYFFLFFPFFFLLSLSCFLCPLVLSVTVWLSKMVYKIKLIN